MHNLKHTPPSHNNNVVSILLLIQKNSTNASVEEAIDVDDEKSMFP